MIDQGKAHLYKGKGLEDINIDERDVLQIEETQGIENIANRDNLKRKRGEQNSDSDSEEQQNEDLSEDLNNQKILSKSKMEFKYCTYLFKIRNFVLEAKGNRKKWKQGEKDIMLKYFKNFIKNKKAPKKQEVENFKLKEKGGFEKIEWVRIKTFIYNQYK